MFSGSGTILGTGFIPNRSTPVQEVVRGEAYIAAENQPLIIPEKAVVVPGTRPINRGQGQDWGLSLYAPVIVKYRNAKTDLRAQLEELLH
jgi:2,3,4,5-tetrahydropyridine-2,6-dicarboxylate N-succinyltransferase